MKKLSICLGLLILLILPRPFYAESSTGSSTVTSQLYDPKSDPEKDLQLALAQARQINHRVLMEVGGNWCTWCKIMERFFDEHKDLLDIRNARYVVLRVNYSPDNKNSAFLKNFPKIRGYPHLFILDSTGKVLHSQDTSHLEEGKSYNLEKFKEFLINWALQGRE